MKRVFIAFLTIMICIGLAACGSSESGEASELQPAKPAANQEESAKTTKTDDTASKDEEITYDNQFEFDGFTITFSPNYSFDKVSNQYSDLNGFDVIVFTATITNNNAETGMVNPFYISVFGSLGKELDSCSTYFDDDLLFGTGDIRSGVTTDVLLHALYDGDGDYYIEFENYEQKIEVKLPVVKQ